MVNPNHTYYVLNSHLGDVKESFVTFLHTKIKFTTHIHFSQKDIHFLEQSRTLITLIMS